MITYESEMLFVQNFNKDIKVESEFSVNGKSFTAKYAGKNDSKQSIYSVTIDGETKKLNITQLKKRLGVTWTAERAVSGSDNVTKTTFADKTDDELMATAKHIADKVRSAMTVIDNIANKYEIMADTLVNGGYWGDNDTWIEIDDIILRSLKDMRERALQDRAEKAEKAEKEKAEKLQSKLKELMKLGLSKDDILSMIG